MSWGTPPALGRTFVAADETAPGADAVIVLTHNFWRTRFGSDPNVVGRTMLINGAAPGRGGGARPLASAGSARTLGRPCSCRSR